MILGLDQCSGTTEDDARMTLDPGSKTASEVKGAETVVGSSPVSNEKRQGNRQGNKQKTTPEDPKLDAV